MRKELAMSMLSFVLTGMLILMTVGCIVPLVSRRRGGKLWDYPVLLSFGAAFAAGLLACLWVCLNGFAESDNVLSNLMELVLAAVGGGMFVFYPALLTLINLVSLFCLPRQGKWKKALRRFEWLTVLLGSLYSGMYALITEIDFGAQWQEQLYNSQIHQPIWSGGLPTVILLALTGVAGYLILELVPLGKLPPLAAVLSMSAMYLGMGECILWCVQMMGQGEWVLCVFPGNCVLIAAKTVRRELLRWRELERERAGAAPGTAGAEKVSAQGAPGGQAAGGADISAAGLQGVRSAGKFPLLRHILENALLWPLLALVLALPLLGILLCILMLFGQQPDALIKAWTETAQWTLSGRTAPPNLIYDEHYLCTVAAGGHERLVKPLRMGERHGHRVVVNRQLCIANAFEQLLEERTPAFHRRLRHFYDTCGLPVARLIRTKWAADAVYLMMKPLEWIFLAVLYLFDPRPEDRIAVQYLPRRQP